MADPEGTLILRDFLPQELEASSDALETFLAQVEKDLQFTIKSRIPREIFEETRICLENKTRNSELMPLLYRVDLDEGIAARTPPNRQLERLNRSSIEKDSHQAGLSFLAKGSEINPDYRKPVAGVW